MINTNQNTQCLILDFSSFIYWVMKAGGEYFDEDCELDRLIDAFLMAMEYPQQWDSDLTTYLAYLEECAKLYDFQINIPEVKRILMSAGIDFINWALPAGLYPQGKLAFQYAGRLGLQAIILTRF